MCHGGLGDFLRVVGHEGLHGSLFSQLRPVLADELHGGFFQLVALVSLRQGDDRLNRLHTQLTAQPAATLRLQAVHLVPAGQHANEEKD